MNVLWLDRAARVDLYDSWLHTDFAIALRKYVNKLYFYAPQMHEKYDRVLVPFVYDPTIPLSNIVNALKIDVVIVNTRSGVYHSYYPKTLHPDKVSVGHCWLPPDFGECRTLKICIEEDFHYETDAVWHKYMGFKVVLQKHYSQSLRKMEVPFESFPFSVDTSIFNPGSNMRKNKLCFAGTADTDCYPQRTRVSTELHDLGLADVFARRINTRIPNKALYKDDYVDCLKNYVSHISCGSKYNLTSAKTFEIMASGSLLFTNKFTGIDSLLDEGSYVTYENDWSDLFEKADKILYDVPFREKVVEKALHCIETKHTHQIRIKELLNLIGKYR